MLSIVPFSGIILPSIQTLQNDIYVIQSMQCFPHCSLQNFTLKNDSSKLLSFSLTLGKAPCFPIGRRYFLIPTSFMVYDSVWLEPEKFKSTAMPYLAMIRPLQ